MRLSDELAVCDQAPFSSCLAILVKLLVLTGGASMHLLSLRAENIFPFRKLDSLYYIFVADSFVYLQPV